MRKPTIGRVSRVLPQLAGIALAIAVAVAGAPARAQQYNSDNYLSKPQGIATIILTAGERNSMWMTTLSLFPRWELTAAAYIYNNDKDPLTDDGYSTSYYAKFMIFENAAKTGGLAVKVGTGLEPGYLNNNGVGLKDAFQTYWTNAPLTLPLFDNKVSWDIMPGASATRDYGPTGETALNFTYATRVSWYPISPKAALAGEVYGAEGEAVAIPEYRIGLRWEPDQFVVIALTYDHEFNGDKGAGVELGVMMFTPPFLCPGGCK